MSDIKREKPHHGHGQVMSNTNLRMLVAGTFAVVSFLLIFIVVSTGVTRHGVGETGTPADWESSSENDTAADSLQYAETGVQNTIQIPAVSHDTMSVEELLEEINLLRRHIVETRVEIMKLEKEKNKLYARSGRLYKMEQELHDLQEKKTTFDQYARSLPREIISSIDRKTRDIGN